MDQVKIGKFIAERRKRHGLTQAMLAERLGITDRAISKWETGKSLPDASLMLELCAILEISVNELLTGEQLDKMDYKKTAEQNLIELAKQEELNNRKLLTLEYVIGFISTISFIALLVAAVEAVEDPYRRGGMIAIAIVVFAVGMYYAMKLEHDAGYYECPNCGNRYVPGMFKMTMAPHVGRNRWMKCPHCEKRGMHKKVLTK